VFLLYRQKYPISNIKNLTNKFYMIRYKNHHLVRQGWSHYSFIH